MCYRGGRKPQGGGAEVSRPPHRFQVSVKTSVVMRIQDGELTG